MKRKGGGGGGRRDEGEEEWERGRTGEMRNKGVERRGGRWGSEEGWRGGMGERRDGGEEGWGRGGMERRRDGREERWRRGGMGERREEGKMEEEEGCGKEGMGDGVYFCLLFYYLCAYPLYTTNGV